MKTGAVLVERSRLVGIAALIGVASVVTSAIGMSVAPGTAPDLALAIVAFGWPFVIALVAAWAGYWRATRTNVEVEVKDGVLHVDRGPVRGGRKLARGRRSSSAKRAFASSSADRFVGGYGSRCGRPRPHARSSPRSDSTAGSVRRSSAYGASGRTLES